jgi:D-3-phosphoglycerate dehydrogenase
MPKNPELKNILITDRFSQSGLSLLQSKSFLQISKSNDTSLHNHDVSEVHGLIIRSRTQIDESVLSRAKKLQVVITATSGFDHIDFKSTKKWGITVMHAPNAHIESAAQLTWGLILSCASKMNTAHKQVKSGEWNRNLLVGAELYQKTLGIVGLGRIGKRVSEIGEVFGMKVIGYDPYIDESVFKECSVTRVSYEELLKSSDVVSFHVPKTQETISMLSASQFAFINPKAIVINACRGGVINEDDLCKALDQGLISACGLDVFGREPLDRNSKLLSFNNVVMTPHIGANTERAFEKASHQSAEKLIAFFKDGTTSDVLPPKAAWFHLA